MLALVLVWEQNPGLGQKNGAGSAWILAEAFDNPRRSSAIRHQHQKG